MRRFPFPVVLLALLLLPVVAAGQAVSIASKAVYAPYTFADFEASGPDNWSYDWEFSDGVDHRTLDDVGRKVLVIAPPGNYTARLTAVGPSGNEKIPFAIKKAVKAFTIGDAPEPVDPDNPDDKKPVGPAPIPDAGFRVLIVYESGDMTKYPIEQQIILTGADVREFLDKNCIKEGNTPAYRIYDPDVDLTNDSPVWQKAMARPRKELPWLIVSHGKTGFEGPLPKTPTAFLELAKKYLPK